MLRRAGGTVTVCLIVIACSATTAEGFEGPDWSVGGEGEVTKAVAVKSASSGTVTLEDTKLFTIRCHARSEGTVEPDNKGSITSASMTECENVKGCSGAITAKAVHLPWSVALAEVEGQPSVQLTNSGKGEPGWLVECTGESVKDECVGEMTVAIDDVSAGVDFNFATKGERGDCTHGGEGTGFTVGTEVYETTGGQLVARAKGEAECGNSEEACKSNNVTVDSHNFNVFGARSFSGTKIYTNHNFFHTWDPALTITTPHEGPASVWTTNGGCLPLLHPGGIPAGHTCTEQLTFTWNNVGTNFWSELQLDGTPTSSIVQMHARCIT
jgi:hypothetical protein